jgi:hypothetical protein
MANEDVAISGIKETVAALKKFDQDAARRLNKVINDELRLAENAAKEQIPDKPPMSGWRTTAAKNPRKSTRGGQGWPAWDPQAIRQGIIKTRSEGRVRADYTTSAGALFNKTASGVIFEVAGRRTPGEGTGRKMIGNLNDRFRKASRGVWAVIDRDRPRIYANIRSAMDDAQKTLKANLNKEKG